MFWERFVYLCGLRGETPNVVARKCGIKSSGSVTGWSKGAMPRDTVLVKIARYFDVPYTFLTGEVDSPTDRSKTHWMELLGEERYEESITKSEYDHIKKYRTLDEYGKKAVDAVLNIENERNESEPEQSEPVLTKVIPLYGNGFAAGVPEPDFGNLAEDYEVPIDSPAKFAIRINGKSMEPYLPDGSIQLGVNRAAKNGEVVAIQINGENVCKQYCKDSEGNLYLFSLNRDYEDITIWKTSDQTVRGIGVILLDKKLPPLPVEINERR